MGHSPVDAWQPRYTLTPAVVRHLLEIEASRAVAEQGRHLQWCST